MWNMHHLQAYLNVHRKQGIAYVILGFIASTGEEVNDVFSFSGWAHIALELIPNQIQKEIS